MSLPAPQPGLVIRYSYLWAEDASKGQEEGEKDRPAAIVVAIDEPSSGQPRVLALPIRGPSSNGTETPIQRFSVR